MSRSLGLLLFFYLYNADAAIPQFILPKTSLEANELAVIVNDADPLICRIGEYYQKRRNIPRQNMIHVRFSPGEGNMPERVFSAIKARVDRQASRSIQAYALTWMLPYRVDCMSITSVFAFGFNKAFCSTQCGATQSSSYFNSPSATPYTDLKIRPAMALAGVNFENVKALIDRGIMADNSRPSGTGYLVSTTDPARNVRAAIFPDAVKDSAGLVDVELIRGDFIENKDDVLFYFTGKESVAHLDSLKFRPGAIADHLTSAGGQLTGQYQMSSVRWLEAGATGSFGTVVEPCNYLAKFPNPAVVMYWYVAGNSLIEAYWKSVQWPGEGIFIGEPLAKPYGGFSVYKDKDEIVLRTQALPPGNYGLFGATSLVGPYHPEPTHVTVRTGINELRFSNLDKAVYRLVRLP